jgi:hypothetical protein
VDSVRGLCVLLCAARGRRARSASDSGVDLAVRSTQGVYTEMFDTDPSHGVSSPFGLEDLTRRSVLRDARGSRRVGRGHRSLRSQSWRPLLHLRVPTSSASGGGTRAPGCRHPPPTTRAEPTRNPGLGQYRSAVGCSILTEAQNPRPPWCGSTATGSHNASHVPRSRTHRLRSK